MKHGSELLCTDTSISIPVDRGSFFYQFYCYIRHLSFISNIIIAVVKIKTCRGSPGVSPSWQEVSCSWTSRTLPCEEFETTHRVISLPSSIHQFTHNCPVTIWITHRAITLESSIYQFNDPVELLTGSCLCLATIHPPIHNSQWPNDPVTSYPPVKVATVVLVDWPVKNSFSALPLQSLFQSYWFWWK